MGADHPKEVKMKSRKFQLIVAAAALGAAMGTASAQQVGMDSAGSVASTPAAAKTATDIQGNAALSSDVALSGTPRQGKPGTQSGPAVMDTTTSMGAGPARYAMASPSYAGLSGTQLRALERYNALR
jgi:hypothetical protein